MADEKCSKCDKVLDVLKAYRCQYQEDEFGDGSNLADVLTPDGDATIERGVAELDDLADDITGTLCIDPCLAANARVEALEAEAERHQSVLDAASVRYTHLQGTNATLREALEAALNCLESASFNADRHCTAVGLAKAALDAGEKGA